MLLGKGETADRKIRSRPSHISGVDWINYASAGVRANTLQDDNATGGFAKSHDNATW